MQNKEPHIRILKNGPYLVTGGVPLSEKIIVPVGDGYIYEEGSPLPQRETYILCRCGKTKTPPFCDGAHVASGFDVEETACRKSYAERATKIKGDAIDLLDDGRCAFARFCHRESGGRLGARRGLRHGLFAFGSDSGRERVPGRSTNGA